MSRIITKPFKATRLLCELSCSELEGCDISGDIPFKIGMPVLNEAVSPQNQFVNGVSVVQFTCGEYSYCVERSIFEASTKKIEPPS